MHDMQEKVPSLRQSNLQLVFLRTISLKGAMSCYCRAFPENVELINSLKLELELELELENKRNDSEKKTTFIEAICHNFEKRGFVFFQDYPNVIRFNLVHL